VIAARDGVSGVAAGNMPACRSQPFWQAMETKMSMKATRRHALAIALGVCAVSSGLALAQQTKREDLNLDKSGVMIHGHDPVAYHTVGKPTKGSAQFTAQHDGGVYWFASAENRDLFAKDPAKYAPAFGGFCAMGASYEKKFNGDPNVWKIVDGKLYLNVNATVGKRWEEDAKGNIVRANAAWPKIKNEAAEKLNAK
jgi:YHS domain-containing protein